MLAVFFLLWGIREAVHIRIYLKEGDACSQCVEETPQRGFPPSQKKQNRGNLMKKLLLIALVASGLAFVPVQSSDAQVYIGVPGTGIGVGVGFGYPGYGYYGYRGTMALIHTVTMGTTHTEPTTTAVPRTTGTTGIEFTIATIATIITTTATKLT
jgi:hypothetical protein